MEVQLSNHYSCLQLLNFRLLECIANFLNLTQYFNLFGCPHCLLSSISNYFINFRYFGFQIRAIILDDEFFNGFVSH